MMFPKTAQRPLRFYSLSTPTSVIPRLQHLPWESLEEAQRADLLLCRDQELHILLQFWKVYGSECVYFMHNGMYRVVFCEPLFKMILKLIGHINMPVLLKIYMSPTTLAASRPLPAVIPCVLPDFLQACGSLPICQILVVPSCIHHIDVHTCPTPDSRVQRF